MTRHRKPRRVCGMVTHTYGRLDSGVWALRTGLVPATHLWKRATGSRRYLCAPCAQDVRLFHAWMVGHLAVAHRSGTAVRVYRFRRLS